MQIYQLPIVQFGKVQCLSHRAFPDFFKTLSTFICRSIVQASRILQTNRPCYLIALADISVLSGDGDCNYDSDCEGSLICGNNNCNQEVLLRNFCEHFYYKCNMISYQKGGLWDSEDDCCARKCSLEACDHGEGTCSSNNECDKSDFHSCGTANCHSEHFEPAILRNNLVRFSSTDNCCMRSGYKYKTILKKQNYISKKLSQWINMFIQPERLLLQLRLWTRTFLQPLH